VIVSGGVQHRPAYGREVRSYFASLTDLSLVQSGRAIRVDIGRAVNRIAQLLQETKFGSARFQPPSGAFLLAMARHRRCGRARVATVVARAGTATLSKVNWSISSIGH
jgi:hypothetical protein